MSEKPDEGVNNLTTSFAVSTFSLDVVKKAAYRLSGRASFDIRRNDGEIVCRLDFPTPLGQDDAEALLAAFRNEVLDQDLRRSIAEETAPIRNAILAYAFSRTDLQNE